MSSLWENESESVRRERTIESLTQSTSASHEHVRGLFADEFARLERGAKVQKFLHILTTSNVRDMLRPLGRVSQAR